MESPFGLVPPFVNQKGYNLIILLMVISYLPYTFIASYNLESQCKIIKNEIE